MKPLKITLMIFIFLVTASINSFAQKGMNDWSPVQQINSGTDLFIKDQKGKLSVGSLVSVNDSELKLVTGNNTKTLFKNEVNKIWLAIPKSKNGAKLPSLAAFFGTLALGVFIAGKVDSENPETLAIPSLLAAGGFAYLVQRSLTKGFKKGKLVYRSS